MEPTDIKIDTGPQSVCDKGQESPKRECDLPSPRQKIVVPNEAVLDILSDAIILFDQAGYIRYSNVRAQDLFGYLADELIGQPANKLASSELQDRVTHLASIQEALAAPNELNLVCRRSDGTRFSGNFVFQKVTAEGGLLLLAIVRALPLSGHQKRSPDASGIVPEQENLKLRQDLARLRELADSDGLTGLKNHRAFHERLREEVQRAARYQTPLSLVMLDIDFFKDFNDTFGHPAGDRVLKTIGDVIHRNLRATDIAARYGGEEFAIILPSSDQESAVGMAERFRSAIEQTAWQERPVTASFGVATFLPGRKAFFRLTGQELTPVQQAAELIEAADQALYHSKHSGRNRVTHRNDSNRFNDGPAPAGRQIQYQKHSPAVHVQDQAREIMAGENLLLFLIVVRWLSLLPPLLTILIPSTTNDLASGSKPSGYLAASIFLLAVLHNFLLTIFHSKLDPLVTRKPFLMGIDMMIVTAFIAFTGGISSPYTLYIYTPVLAAAFFFQIRGGLIAATAFTLFYLLALAGAHFWTGDVGNPAHPSVVLSLILSFYLAALILGHPSILLQRLHSATIQLESLQHEMARIQTLAAIGKMSAKLSHEIRNPLSAIGGFAARLVRHPDDREKVQRYSQIIVEESNQLEELLNDTLSLSSPRQLKRQPEDIHAILDKARLLCEGMIDPQAPISVRKLYAPNLPAVECDAAALLRAFLNVIRNAIQVMPHGGTLTIKTQRQEQQIEIVISDTGPGIPANILPTLFEPFVSHHEHGTGLGLVVAQEIVEQHGGDIEVQSAAGQGASFIFHLPIKASGLKHTSRTPEPISPGTMS